MNEELEIPDLGTEEEQLAALEAITLDIDGFLNGVQEAGGVSRAMAEKASHLLPEETNYAYYSQTPTQTNLKVTLEAIDVKSALLIAGAVAAVAVLAIKVFQYIKKSREKIGFIIKVISGYVDSIERCLKVADQLESKLGPEAKKEVADQTKELQEFYSKAIGQSYSPFAADILSNGVIAHALADAHGDAKSLFEKVEKSVKLMEEIVYGNTREVDASLLIDPSDMSLPDKLKKIHPTSADKAGSAMAEIAQKLAETNKILIPFKGDLEDFFHKHKKYTGSDSKVYGKGFPQTTQLEEKMEKLEAQMAKKKDIDPELRNQINKVSYSIRAGVQQLMGYTRMTSAAASVSRTFWLNVEKYSAAKLRRVAAVAVQSDNQEVKEVLHQASKIKLS